MEWVGSIDLVLGGRGGAFSPRWKLFALSLKVASAALSTINVKVLGFFIRYFALCPALPPSPAIFLKETLFGIWICTMFVCR